MGPLLQPLQLQQLALRLEFREAVTRELEGITPVMPAIRVSALGTDAVVDGCLAAGTELAWGQVMTALPTAPSADGARQP